MDGEGEECEGVGQGPEGAGVAAVVGLAPPTVDPLRLCREERLTQLEERERERGEMELQ